MKALCAVKALDGPVVVVVADGVMKALDGPVGGGG
jgi:hypothetical protein